jgi:hypothetical protein
MAPDVTRSEEWATKREPAEINVQARLCSNIRYHSVGELVTYRSALWVVKGLYFGSVRSGQRELFYILSETTASLPPVEDVDDAER